MEADVVILLKALWKMGYMFILPIVVPSFVLGKWLKLI